VLYGWLFARHAGGQLFLRPMGERVSPVWAGVCDELRFLGLDWELEAQGRPAEVSHVFGALGEASPEYVSLPPIAGSQVGVPIGEWIDQGYSGPALANCLARLGWSPRGKRVLLSLDELAERFDLGRVSRRPTAFDPQDLDWFNRRWLGGLGADEVTALLAPQWLAAYGRADRAAGTALSPGQWQETLALAIREELVRPAQAVEKARFIFLDDLSPDEASQRILAQPYAAPILEAFARQVGTVQPFEFGPLDAFCRELRLRFKGTLGVRSRDVMYVLRAALTGRQDGPCLVVACQLLGPDRCVQRSQQAASPLSPP